MSNGGRFILTINKGQQDILLNAHELLNKQINNYILSKTKQYTSNELNSLPKQEGGYFNLDNALLPSLSMLEKTHNVFVNGTYKPYVPISYEYIKVPFNSPNFGQNITFTLPQVGNFISDMMFHIKISGLRAKDNRDRVRYVGFTAHRLLENVRLEVDNGVLIDEYGTEEYNEYYDTRLTTESSKRAWCKNVGQELKKEGTLTADPTYDLQREYRMVSDGFQTLKYSHDTMELMVPALFWFTDFRNALPSHIIPWGKLQVNVKLADVADIVGFADYGGGGDYYEPVIEFCNLYVNNLFVTDEIFQLYVNKFVFSLIRTHQRHRELVKTASSSTYSTLLHNLRHPVEQMYFCFRPRENLDHSQNWYRNCKLIEKTYKVPVMSKNTSSVITGNITTATNNTAILSGAGLSAVDNAYNTYDFTITGGTGYNNLDIVKNRYTITNYIGATNTITISGTWNDLTPNSTTTFELFTPELSVNTVSYYEEIPTVKTISLKAADNEIWRSYSEAIYNSFTAFRFRNNTLSPPIDRGSYFINFNLYPLHRQPSGSVNFSTCREIYLNYTSDVISAEFPVDLIVLSRSINFLLVDKGSLTLRYL